MILNKNDEWYTPYNVVCDFMDKLNLKLYKQILLPFDNMNSSFVQYCCNNGINFINSHIDDGKDFFKYWSGDKDFKDCDFIISNPPYSKKVEVLEQLIFWEKPFCMLMSTGIFNNQKCLELLDNPFISFVFVKKRIKFIGAQNTPPFNCVWVCYKTNYPFKVI